MRSRPRVRENARKKETEQPKERQMDREADRDREIETERQRDRHCTRPDISGRGQAEVSNQPTSTGGMFWQTEMARWRKIRRRRRRRNRVYLIKSPDSKGRESKRKSERDMHTPRKPGPTPQHMNVCSIWSAKS